MQPFHERLRIIMDSLNLNSNSFGERTGINPVSVRRFVAGATKPSLDTLERICECYPLISAEYLLKGIGAPFLNENQIIESDHKKTLAVLFEVQSKINGLLVETVKEVQNDNIGFTAVR